MGDTKNKLSLMRKPFEAHQISKLPKGTKAQNQCPPAEKRNCSVCGGWHHPRIIHLDYVGHAAVTDRLLDVDPEWSWEPMALDESGLPLFDRSGGLWIKLTVCGVTRLGYGHAADKTADPGSREKEVIGDALRNACMRFGAALELWHKGELHKDEPEETPAKESPFVAPPATEELEPEDIKSVALVDLSYLFKRTWHGIKDPSPEEVARSVFRGLLDIRSVVDRVVVCCDSPPYFRSEIDPEYKAQREPPTNEEVFEKRRLMAMIKDDGRFPVARAGTFEADDVIATLVSAPTELEMRIVASDKDLACLVNDRVSMHVPSRGGAAPEVRGPAEVKAKHGVEPMHMPLLLALCGDKSDNVPGVPGVGPKRAAALINEHGGTLTGIAKALADDQIKGEIGKAIAEHWDAVHHAAKLIELRRDVPLDVQALLGVKPTRQPGDE